MILSIHYLRGAAALLVVLYHLRYALSFPIGSIPDIGEFLFGQGYIGVDLFFIISGFVIVLSTEKNRSISLFISKRFFRIYPLYAFCLVMILCLNSNTLSLSQIARAFLLIHANYSESAPWFGYSVVTVAWTISYEILFYVLFCIAMSISHKYRVVLSSVAIVISTCMINLFYGGGLSLDGYYAIPPNYGVLRFISSPMLYEFVAGMALGTFYINIDKFRFIKVFVPAISTAGIMYFMLFYFGLCNGGHGLSNSGFVAFSLLLSLILIEVFYGFSARWTLMTLGDLSYSIYLNQAVVFALAQYLNGVMATINPVGAMFVQISLIVALSFVTFFYIEKPSMLVARKITTFILGLVQIKKYHQLENS